MLGVLRALIVVSVALGIGGSSSLSAFAAGGQLAIRYQYTWTVTAAPAGAWDVTVSGSRIFPNYWAGPHTHPGPEFGIILDGQGQRWNQNAGQYAVGPRGAFTTPGGVVHEGGNTSDGDAMQLTTHLIPLGGAFNTPTNPPPAGAPAGAAQLQAALYRIKFPFTSPPAPPFKLSMRVADLAPGNAGPFTAAGTSFSVVVDGRLNVTIDGKMKTYGIGDSFQLNPGAVHTFAVLDGAQATLVQTIIGG